MITMMCWSEIFRAMFVRWRRANFDWFMEGWRRRRVGVPFYYLLVLGVVVYRQILKRLSSTVAAASAVLRF